MTKIVLHSRVVLPPAWIGCVLAAGVALSLAVFAMLRGWEERDLQKRAGNLAREQVEKIQAGMLRSLEALHAVAALYAARGRMDRQEFRRFVQGTLARQPEILALSWNPAVSESDRPGVEAEAVAQGMAGFEFRELDAAGKLVSARPRRDHVPVLFIEPSDGNGPVLGYDLESDPSRRAAVELARDTGQAVATAPLRLTQDAGKEAGFLVLLPVYRGGEVPAQVADRRRELGGCAVAVFRMTNLVESAFQKLKAQGIEAAVFDQAVPEEPVFREAGWPRLTSGEHPESIPLEVANRQWTVRYAPTPAFAAGQSHGRSGLVLASGLGFSVLTTAYLVLSWRQTRRVALANAALQEEVKERQRAEAVAESANRAKTDFLARMSHEFRTPLNAILGYTQLLQRDPDLSGEQRDGLASIRTSGQHLLGLINEILDLSKIEAGRMELNPVDFDLARLGRTLAATFQALCSEKRIAFRLFFEGNGRDWVKGDESKLRQVLINLLGNAVKFTQAGQVQLRIQRQPDGGWRFEVIDTGLGIPEEERGAIFEPFHQGRSAQHQGGTGLGLAIARRQVELLGGSLQLQSERGSGSRFHFRIQLPAAPPGAEPEVNAPVVHRLKRGCRARALVADDRRENREILGSMLTRIGCEVVEAGGGAEALRLAREAEPQIVFLDLLMPDLDGLVAARQLLAWAPRLKVVAHTASALGGYREQALAAGCVDFLLKPIRAEQVYECLRNHLAVDFEYASPAPEPTVCAAWDATPVGLPGELYSRLTTAAELHSTTALKLCVQELRQIGPDACRLGDEIRVLMRSYDMNGILRLISRAATPAGATGAGSSSYGFTKVQDPAT